MQFLGGPPGAVVAVFSKMIHDESHVFQMADPRFRMAEPKTFRMTTNQRARPLAQFHRGRRRGRQFAQLIGLGNHESNVKSMA